MKLNHRALAVGTAACLFVIGGNIHAADLARVTNAPVDKAAVSVERIAKDSPIHVQLFDSANADLGKPRHQDTAAMLARSAPHLLAVDIVEALRNSGFSNVVLDEQAPTSSTQHLTLTGKFTDINPGSQATRAWIGFGAGKSKVCVTGHIGDANGNILGEFSHCRKGLGWGDSGDQMEQSTVRIGDTIAEFLTDWADGQYAR